MNTSTNESEPDLFPHGHQGRLDTRRMADGQILTCRHWPLQGAKQGVLVVHGLGEHSGRYQHVADWFHARGRDVRAYDLRGHGQSPGARGALRKADDMLTDLAEIHSDYARRFDTPPLLLGHSMGGLIALRAVLDKRVQPSALVLSSPALRSHESSAMQMLARLLARLAPNLPLRNGLKTRYLSHDPEVVRAYEHDPLCHNRITPRLADFIFRTGDACIADAANLAVPTLLLAAGDDQLVDPSGSRDFIAAAPPSKLDGMLLEGLYHEIFNEDEPARSRVFARVGAWLDALDR